MMRNFGKDSKSTCVWNKWWPRIFPILMIQFWIVHRNRNSLQWLVDVNAEDPSERGKSHESWVQHLVTAIWKGITPILHQTFPLEPGLSLFGIHQSLWQNTKRSKIRIIVVFLAKLCSQNLIVIHLKVFIDLESVEIVRGNQGDVERLLALLVSASKFHVHLCVFWNWIFAIF